MTTPTDPESAITIMPALCLDFDGTIRYSSRGTFISGPDDVRLYADVEAKLWEYRQDGWLICGVTNQGGVAYGYHTIDEIQANIDATLALFDENPFQAVLACFHHPGGHVPPYNIRSLSRKPDIGMLAEMERQVWARGIAIDWDNSLMVGDSADDEGLATNARIAFQWAWEFFEREKPQHESGEGS